MNTLVERFWAKVNKDGPIIRPELGACWIWTGSTVRGGYGQIGRGGRNGGAVAAHRLSMELHGEAVSPGDEVCHKCDNPPCVRPDHLFLGTRQDNAADKVAKGRQARGPRLGITHHGKRLAASNTSEFRGVSWFGPRGKWTANIKAECRRSNLGYFASAIDAALAYDRAARSLYGERAFQNFRPSNAIETLIKASMAR